MVKTALVFLILSSISFFVCDRARATDWCTAGPVPGALHEIKHKMKLPIHNGGGSIAFPLNNLPNIVGCYIYDDHGRENNCPGINTSDGCIVTGYVWRGVNNDTVDGTDNLNFVNQHSNDTRWMSVYSDKTYKLRCKRSYTRHGVLAKTVCKAT